MDRFTKEIFFFRLAALSTKKQHDCFSKVNIKSEIKWKYINKNKKQKQNGGKHDFTFPFKIFVCIKTFKWIAYDNENYELCKVANGEMK